MKILIFIFFLGISSCNRSIMHDSINMNWKISKKNKNNNIELYEGYNSSVPLRAWVAIIPSKNNKIEILVSNDDDGVETPSEIAINRNASVVINGGYFARGQNPMRHIGLLKSNNILICLLYTSPSPRDATLSRMPSSA